MGAEWGAAVLAAGAVTSTAAGVWAIAWRAPMAQKLKRRANHEQLSLALLIGQERIRRLVRLVPGIGGALLLFFGMTLYSPGLPVLAATLALGGFLIPPWVGEWRETQRLMNLSEQLGRVMTMVSTALRRGMPLEVALAEAAQMVPYPLGPALRHLTEATKMGVTLAQAVEQVRGHAAVQGSKDFQVFATEMVICHERGANVIQAFDALRQVLEARRRYRNQVREQMGQHLMQAIVISGIGLGVLAFYGAATDDGLGPLLERLWGQLLLGMSIVGNLFLVRTTHLSLLRQTRKV
jgi:Flp pilus assembly protein TadB